MRPSLNRNQTISRHELRAIAQTYGDALATVHTLVEIGMVDQYSHITLWSEVTAAERAQAEHQIAALHRHAESLGFYIPAPKSGRSASKPIRWRRAFQKT
jgi:hypothetical protein